VSAPGAWERAEAAGRVARELGEDLAQLRKQDQALSRWHPLAIVAAGFAAGALFGRIAGRIKPPTAAAGLMVPLGAWLQRTSMTALQDWWRSHRADPPGGADGQGESAATSAGPP